MEITIYIFIIYLFRQLEHEMNELAKKKQEYEILLTELKDKLTSTYQHQKERQDILYKHESRITTIQHKLEELQQIEYPNESDVKILVRFLFLLYVCAYVKLTILIFD